MPEYRRADQPGGTFFFTLVTYRRIPWLCEPAALAVMHDAIVDLRTTRPFHIDAWVTLPDHLHCIWSLPEGDTDYSERWRLLKRAVSRRLTPEVIAGFSGGAERYAPLIAPSHGSRQTRGERNLWQRRFWEHLIRDQRDFDQHCDYIHYNPVKHGLVSAAAHWPYSSFHRFVVKGWYGADWGMSAMPSIDEGIGRE